MNLSQPIQVELTRRWTNLTKECYSINCICKNCSFIPQQYKSICKVKNYVLALYRKFGKPCIKTQENISVQQNENEKF